MKTEDIRRKAPIPLKDCGVFLAADLIGDRWVLLILREAFYGVVRFDDIQQDLQIPRAVLTSRLKRLVDTGLLDKQPYREPGSRQRYAYTLTAKGQSLAPVIIAMMQWGDEQLRDDPAPLAVVHAKTGKPLTVALVESDTITVAIKDLRIKMRI